jgi:hypothetical protein
MSLDSVSSEEIQAAVRVNMARWIAWINQPDDPDWRLPLAEMAYIVETMCRVLYTLATGELASKRQSVAWALETLSQPWRATVEHSRLWRNDQLLDPSIASEVRAFVLWTAMWAEGR